MKKLTSVWRFLRMLLFAFMLSICMVLGIAPVIPKRKEQFGIEVQVEDQDENFGKADFNYKDVEI